MKQKRLVVVGVLIVVAVAGWLARFDLALGHVRGRLEQPGPAPVSLAWTILGGFADRPELEAFVRERLLALPGPALGIELARGLEVAPLLDLAGRVYERQPERVDAAVVAAALTIECLQRCGTSRGYAEAPVFASTVWPAALQTSDVFRAGLRSAANALATYATAAGSWNQPESYAALVTVAAAGVTNRDDELAGSVVAYVLAANPEGDNMRWLSAVLRRLTGADDLGPTWARALSRQADIDISPRLWNTLVETFRDSPTLAGDDAAEAVMRQCAHRSRPPAAVDEPCLDLALAWSRDWAPWLRAVAAASTPEGQGASALLAAYERERTRTWRDVVAGWRAVPGITTEAVRSMATWQYARPSGRPVAREIAVLLAAGSPALAEVAALYRTSSNPGVINDAAFVLSEGSPRMLSAAVMDHIERFRLRAAPSAKPDLDDVLDDLTGGLAAEVAAELAADVAATLQPDAANYALEARRVAAGLLALESEGRATTRIHPLILALSIPVREFSERASGTLRELLNASEFADALFGFLAVREEYLVSEVDVYRKALTAYDGVSPAIEANLTRLLAAAGGVPERVPWILKVIGISALASVGGATALPLLGQYARDTGSYREFSSRSDDSGRVGRDGGIERRFSLLAQCARREVDLRLGTTGSASSSLSCTFLRDA